MCCELTIHRTCIASVFVLIESINFDSDTKEMPLDSAMNEVWAAVEVNMAIVSGINPTDAPSLWQRLMIF